MVFPSEGKCTNIVEIDTSVINVEQYLLHNVLGKIRGAFESHGELFVFVLTKRHNNDAEFLAGFVKLKGVVLHGNIKFCKMFVARNVV